MSAAVSSGVVLLALVMTAATTAKAYSVCPASLSPFEGQLTVFYMGTQEVYDFIISPTTPSSATPSNDGSCETANYISQYTPGGGCVASFARAGGATVTDFGCQYRFFNDMGVAQAVMNITCDPSAGSGVTFASMVTTTFENSGMWYVFSGSSADVCGQQPATLIQQVCSDSFCSQNCLNYTLSQDQCTNDALGPASGLASAVYHCNSPQSLTTTVYPRANDCSGPYATSTVSTGTCIPNSGGENGAPLSSMAFCLLDDGSVMKASSQVKAARPQEPPHLKAKVGKH